MTGKMGEYFDEDDVDVAEVDAVDVDGSVDVVVAVVLDPTEVVAEGRRMLAARLGERVKVGNVRSGLSPVAERLVTGVESRIAVSVKSTVDPSSDCVVDIVL